MKFLEKEACKRSYQHILRHLYTEVTKCRGEISLHKHFNAAAKMTCLIPKVAHITPVLMNLHWLPIKFRGEFKIVLLVFNALHGIATCYIIDLLSFKYESTYQSRSYDLSLLQVRKTNAKTLGDRPFKYAAPSICNMLPISVRQCKTLDSFKTQLKTFLCRKAFNIKF